MEYDAYHKLSLAQIDTVDPVPQVTDVDAFVTAIINQIGQKLGGSMDVLFNGAARWRQGVSAEEAALIACLLTNSGKRLIFSSFSIVAVVQHAAVAEVVEQLELAAFRAHDDVRLGLQVLRRSPQSPLHDGRLH